MPAQSKDNGPTCPATDNPITLGSGNKWLVEADVGGPGSTLSFTRTYNSKPGTLSSALGARWRTDYSQQLVFETVTGTVWAFRPDGKSITFVLSGGAYVTDADVMERLYADTGGGAAYRLHRADQHVERYDSSGRLISLTSSTGQTQTLAYDAQNRLTTVSDAFGRQIGFTYDAQNRISTLIAAAGVFAYTYDASNNLSTVTYPDTRVKTYHYNEAQFTGGANLPNALTGITDENGVRYVNYNYDSMGKAVEESYPAAGSNTNHYALSFGSNSTTVTDPRGTARTYTFQNILGVVKSTGSSQPGGSGCGPASSAITYDGNGNVATRSDFNGNLTAYSYDLARNLETQRVEASGTPEARTISTQWHSTWRLPVKVAEPKKLTTWIYNGDTENGSIVSCAPAGAVVPSSTGGPQPIGVLCKKTEQATNDASGNQGVSAPITGLPRTWAYTYDGNGQLLTLDGPRTDVTDVTTYTYYDIADPDLGKRGNLATVSNALGQETQITAYDLNGNPLTLTDPNGRVTTLTYDLRQRLTSRQVGTELTGYQYDGMGQLTKVTLPDGRYLTYTYDAAHRLTDVADALGNTIHYTLDAMGNRTREDIKDPGNQLARTRQRVYDALNRLAQDIGAQNQSTAYEYDANGNRTKVTDPLNRSTVSTYDALNRLLRLTDPGSGQTQFGWDGQDRLTQVTDPRSLITRYTVDGLGNRQQLQSPDTGTTVSTYDAAGNEITRTDAKGQITTTAYDALNRPTLITFHDGTQIRATWDQGANGKGRLGKLEEISGGTVIGTIQTAYDGNGRILSETRRIGSVTHVLGYTWSGGQLGGTTLPSGRQLTYARNAAGQISQLTLTDIAPNAGQSKVIASAIAYHPFGGLKSWTDGAGQIHNRNQDQDGRPTGYTLGSTPWLISYDAASRITAQIDGSNAANSALYGYDSLDRLTGAQLPVTTYGYGYDATGNRTTQTVGAATRTYTTDPASNRLQSLGSTPPKTYSIDANGSTVGDGQNQWAYDTRGRLTSATTAVGTTTYQINALGQRVRKTTPGSGGTFTDTLYHYDLAGHLVAESDATGKITREYLWLEDTPLAVLQ